MFLANPERWLMSPDVIDHTLSLAVRVTDAYSGESTRASVTLGEVSREPVLNNSGFYCFSGLAPGIYDLDVSDVDRRRPRFFPHADSIDIAALPANSPMIGVDLLPAPNYPFPASATLIRGLLKDGAGDVVGDAVVEATLTVPPPAGIEIRPLSPTVTAADGQIVVALQLSGSDLGLLPTVYPGGIPVELQLRKGANIATASIAVAEARTNSVGVVTF